MKKIRSSTLNSSSIGVVMQPGISSAPGAGGGGGGATMTSAIASTSSEPIDRLMNMISMYSSTRIVTTISTSSVSRICRTAFRRCASHESSAYMVMRTKGRAVRRLRDLVRPAPCCW